MEVFDVTNPQFNEQISPVDVPCLFVKSLQLELGHQTAAIKPMTLSPHVRESEKFLFVDSGILGFDIRNTAQGVQIPLATGSRTKNRDYSTWNPESTA